MMSIGKSLDLPKTRCLPQTLTIRHREQREAISGRLEGACPDEIATALRASR